MAKSTRSKVKRAFRAKKRTDGVFAAAEAARLQRLNAKVRGLATTEEQEGAESKEWEDADADADADADMPGADNQPAQTSTGKISTHGPRGSRREQWRVSKGMKPRPKSKGMNRQGIPTARYKAGRSHRRR
ncbi:hypothetical protein BC834DRAFT_820509 [Gloeopeniophorella convolvens]|nr:hypothetical protein BC834DRAFT_820509 [Gloeopeniophorella convolvens]